MAIKILEREVYRDADEIDVECVRVCVRLIFFFFLLFRKMIKWLLDSILHVNSCVFSCVCERNFIEWNICR